MTKFLGHSVHRMLIAFPVAMFVTSVVFDVVHLVTNEGLWAEIAYWMIAVGVVGGLAAALFGLLDWFRIPTRTRAKGVATIHGLGNVGVVALFIVSWFLRADAPAAPGTLPIVLSFVGVATAGVTAWLGGEMVERFGLAIHSDADVDAPMSIAPLFDVEDIDHQVGAHHQPRLGHEPR